MGFSQSVNCKLFEENIALNKFKNIVDVKHTPTYVLH